MKKNFTFSHFSFAAFLLMCLFTTTSCNKDGVIQSQAHATVANNVRAKDNLVAWYTFDGDIKDHSGNGNDVTFNNAKPTAGKGGTSNTAYLFNGTSNYMSVPNSASLNPSSGITIMP